MCGSSDTPANRADGFGNRRCTLLQTLHGAEVKTNAKYAPGTSLIHPAEGRRWEADQILHVINLNRMGSSLGVGLQRRHM